jgi:hypothetical protein
MLKARLSQMLGKAWLFQYFLAMGDQEHVHLIEFEDRGQISRFLDMQFMAGIDCSLEWSR